MFLYVSVLYISLCFCSVCFGSLSMSPGVRNRPSIPVSLGAGNQDFSVCSLSGLALYRSSRILSSSALQKSAEESANDDRGGAAENYFLAADITAQLGSRL